LVDLLTFEVQSYGEECLAGSKVVEHVAAAACSSANVSMPQPTAAPAPVIAAPVRPQPPQPAPPVVTSNTFIQPSKHAFLSPVMINNNTVVVSIYVDRII